jgi:hypothetical protein
MANRPRDVDAIKRVYSLLKNRLSWDAWIVNWIRPPVSGARGFYDLILINSRFHPNPLFIRVERTQHVIKNDFDFNFHFSSEIFLTTHNPNMILIILARNGLIIFNPRKCVKILKRNDQIRSDLFI